MTYSRVRKQLWEAYGWFVALPGGGGQAQESEKRRIAQAFCAALLRRSWIWLDNRSTSAIEQFLRSSGSGDAPEDSFALGRIGETGTDIFPCQRGKIREDLVLAHPRGQVGEDIADRDARPANGGLAEADLRVDDDPVVVVHNRNPKERRAAGQAWLPPGLRPWTDRQRPSSMQHRGRSGRCSWEPTAGSWLRTWKRQTGLAVSSEIDGSRI